MKKVVFAVSLSGVLLASPAAFAAEVVSWWKCDLSDSAAEKTYDGAADWFTAANWKDDSIGEGANNRANFYVDGNNWDKSGLRYTKLDRDLTIGTIMRAWKNSRYRNTWDANKRVLLLNGHVLTLSRSEGTMYLRGLNIYGRTVFAATATNSLNPIVSHVDFCGPVEYRLASHMRLSGLTRETAVRFRRDRWADSTDPAVTNIAPMTYSFDEGGFFAFVAPHGSDGVSGLWDTQEGSAVVRLSAGADPHVLTAGAAVTGEGIPVGAFVKYVYTDEIVELSQPATATATGVELTFGAYRAQMYQRIDGYQTVSHSSPYQIGFRPFKYRPEDECVVEIPQLKNTYGTYHLLVDSDEYQPTMLPGRVIFRNTAGFDRNLTLGSCEVEFATTTNGTVAGFPNTVMMVGTNRSDKVARVLVPEGVTAAFGQLDQITGTFVKDGAGTLSAPVGTDTFTASAGDGYGSLVVEQGLLTLTSDEPTSLVFEALAVTNGATLNLPDGNVRAQSLLLEPGSRLSYTGRLFVASDTLIPEGVLSSGITLVRSVPQADIEKTKDLQQSITAEAAVVGTPARWFDASDMDSFVYAPPEIVHSDYRSFTNKYPSILSWLDHRGASYGTATCYWASATVARAPSLFTNAQGRAQHVYIASSSSTTETSRNALKWDAKTTGIRSVFKVTSTAMGGGILFGDSQYGRGTKRTYTYNEPLFYNVPESWTNTPFYVNGEARDWRQGYPYQRGELTKIEMHEPMVVEFHAPTDNWYGGNFGYQNKDTGGNGQQLIYECLIYTNELTETERLSVRKYLMKKWCPDVHAPEYSTQLDDLDTTLEVGNGLDCELKSGEKVVYASVSGVGTIGKHGAGDLELDEISGNDLTVVEGTLSVKSVPVPTAADVGDPYFHADASDADSFVEMSGTTVRTWRDTRGAGYPSATAVGTTVGPTLEEEGLKGKPVVDLGVGRQCSNAALPDNAKSLAYPVVSNAHTVISLVNTAQGGACALFGFAGTGVKPYEGKAMNGGFYRASFPDKSPAFLSDYTVPMVNVGSYFSSAGYYAVGCSNGIPGGVHARLNGANVVPQETGYTGGWDLVSLSDPEPVNASGIGQMPYTTTYSVCGGFKLAETLVYTNVLTRREVKRVEAYLRNKWLDATTPGERPAVAGRLTVAAGATFEVFGGAPVSVSGLAVAGTVTGALALREEGVIEVVVKEDGTVDPIDVSDGVTLPAQGTLRLVGAVANLQKGSYPLFSTPTASLGAGWTVDCGGVAVKRQAGAAVREGQLWLDVTSFGLFIFVK